MQAPAAHMRNQGVRREVEGTRAPVVGTRVRAVGARMPWAALKEPAELESFLRVERLHREGLEAPVRRVASRARVD
jgi:hypothetical protein